MYKNPNKTTWLFYDQQKKFKRSFFFNWQGIDQCYTNTEEKTWSLIINNKHSLLK